MKKNILNILIFIVFQTTIFGQIKLNGIIVDKSNQLPVEYTNIGINDKGIGTICDTNGQFDFTIPNDLKNDFLIITHLGFKDLSLNINELSKEISPLKIEMEPVLIELNEVIINTTKDIVIGYKPNTEKIKGFFNAKGLGLEVGTLIKNNGITILKNFNLNILKIPFDSLKFRINFYSIKKDKPYNKINKRDIIFKLTNSDNGHFTLNLTKKNIQVKNDFICTLELIDFFGKPLENAEFNFSAIPDNEGLLYKKSKSFNRWEVIKKYSLCFWFDGKK